MPGLVPRLSGCAKKSRHARESKWNRTSRRLGRACPGHPRRAVARSFRSWRLPLGVDARDKPGHDDSGLLVTARFVHRAWNIKGLRYRFVARPCPGIAAQKLANISLTPQTLHVVMALSNQHSVGLAGAPAASPV